MVTVRLLNYLSKKIDKKQLNIKLIADVPVGTCLSGGWTRQLLYPSSNKLLIEQVKEVQSVGDVQKTFSAVFSRRS